MKTLAALLISAFAVTATPAVIAQADPPPFTYLERDAKYGPKSVREAVNPSTGEKMREVRSVQSHRGQSNPTA